MKRLVTEEYLDNSNVESQTAQNGHHVHLTDLEVQQRRSAVVQDAGSDDDDTEDELDTEDMHSVDALEDQFLLLEEEVATLVADVHDLALYTKLNITGFMKILKVCLRRVSSLDAGYSHKPTETRRESKINYLKIKLKRPRRNKQTAR